VKRINKQVNDSRCAKTAQRESKWKEKQTISVQMKEGKKGERVGV
jgi:hypothetical protein